MREPEIARRLQYASRGVAKLEEIPLSSLLNTHVRVRTSFSGISRGTESLVFHGRVPVSEWQIMRCPGQVGEFRFPVVYGYSSVGTVVETGIDVKNLRIGDKVFALHPHQTLFDIDETMCQKLPENLPQSRAILAANMETALNAVWDADIARDLNLSVIGAGVVGLLTAYLLHKFTGKTPLIIDISPEKAEIAKALGLSFCLAKDVNSEALPPQDRVFNTSASETGLQLAIDITAFEGRIVEMSWYGDKSVTLNLGGAFHSKRLTLLSSQVGHVSPSRRANYSHGDRMKEALNLLTDPVLNNLIEDPIDFDELPDHLHDLFSQSSKALCQSVRYTPADGA